MRYLLETCCASLEAVRCAVRRGTDRIELCEDLFCGGITPSGDLIQETLALAGRIPVNVLVRPRPGNFVYMEDEVRAMLDSIGLCKRLGVNGVVLGALTPEGDVDIPVMRRLLAEARPLSVTFHRAFDETRDPGAALEEVIGLGIERLLTSGHCATAYEGRSVLKKLVDQARGRIVIMPGCGVTPTLLEELAAVTGAVEFHGSKL